MTMALFLFLVLFSCSVLRPASANVVLEDTSISFPSVPANFAPAITDAMGICGALQVADPLDGCAPLLLESNGTETANFVVVAGGQCAYDVKVRYAQNAGFRAAIVYDDQPDRKLITMSGNSNGINIYAVYVSRVAGEFLTRHAQVQKKGDCCIIPTSPTKKHRKFLIAFIGIVFVVAMVGLIVFVVRRWWRWCCPSNSHSEGSIDPRTMQPFPNLRVDTMTVNQLPGFRFRFGNRANYPASITCPICLENYNEREVVASLPCEHEFHASCVTTLLHRGGTTLCPVCRHDVRVFSRR